MTQQPLVQNGQPDAAVLPKQGLVRRWEGGAPVIIALNQVLKLERGIEITLAPATGHADVGDYWLIPARSLSAAIEWPVDAARNGAAALPPHGIAHAYCPLAIVQKTDAGWAVKDDCRPILRTNAEGVAAAAFTIPNSRHANHVTAELLDASDPPQASRVHLPITFTATTSIAGEVAYDPAACAFQNAAAVAPGVAKTVQAAIDKLCPRIDFVPLGGGGQSLCANLPAPAPLKVGLFWGKQPLKGAKVAFKVEFGDAKVNPDFGNHR